MRPTQLGIVGILTMVGMLVFVSVLSGPCSTPRSTAGSMLQLTVEPERPRVGEARLTIDVRCGCLTESFNGPPYAFAIEGDDVELVKPPAYDQTADVYYATLRFGQAGTHSLWVEVTEPGEHEAFRSNGIEVAVLRP